MPIPARGLKRREKRLVKLFSGLREQDQETLIVFAEFLATRGPRKDPPELLEPKPRPRPEKESVVAAIKRLSTGYPMLAKESMLGETSSLMTQHIMQGRDAGEVIDDLEQLFQRHYRKTLKNQVEDS